MSGAPATSATPRIELLGLPRLLLPHEAPHVLERRDAALLAWLALNGPTPRQRIVGLLWPDVPTHNAQSSLRQRLFRMKRRSGDEIVVSAPVMALAEGVRHDLDAGLTVLDAAAPAGATQLLGALVYDDCGELGEWVANARERWQAERRKQLADEAARLEAAGRIAEALVFAERLVVEAPMVEHAHRRVMRLHYRRGDRAAALAAFERCQRLLGQTIGARPSVETQQLASTIERSGAVPDAMSHPTPVTVLRPPRLVGRDAQWHAIDAAWSQRRPVLVEGEAGIGKTRLIADYAQHRGGAPVFGARPGDAGIPYSTLARGLHPLAQRFGAPEVDWARAELARLLPDWGAAPAGDLQTLRLWQALATTLGAWRQRGLQALVVDDLQFADEATLEWLLHLAGQGDDTEPWVLMSVRADEHPAALARWLAAHAPIRLTRVRLEPMNEPAVATLLDSLELPGLDGSAWAAPMLAACGGNPFYLLDALIALHAQGQRDYAAGPRLPPRSVQRTTAVLHRLDQQAADARQLAQVAAAAGQDFGVDLAAEVLACTPVALATPWRALERAGVFGGDAGFAHDLAGQAVQDALPTAVSRALHRQIAEWLARADAGTAAPRSARIAAHWEAAQDLARAAPCHEQAAREARERSARRDELLAFRAAARCHRAAGLPGGAAAAFECEWRCVRLLPGVETLDDALAFTDALLGRATDERQRAAALVARAHIHAERMDADAALADAQAAEAMATANGDTRMALLATQQAALALMRQAKQGEALRHLQQGAADVRLLEDDERLGWLGNYATALDYADRRVEAMQVFDQAIAQAEQLGRWEAASELLCNQAIAVMYLNRLQDATDAARRALESGRRAGFEPASLLLDELSLSGNLRDLGRFTEYLAMAEPMPQAMRDTGYAVWATIAENDLAIGYAWLGRPDLARKALTALTGDEPPMIRASRLFTEARLLRARPASPGGDGPARLVREAHALMESAGGAGRSYVRLKIALELARDEAPMEGAHRAAAVEIEAMQREQFMLATHALLLRVELLRRGGDHALAAVEAQRLVAACARDGTSPGLYAPELWWVAHQALAQSDPATASACLQQAVDWIQRTSTQHVPDVFRDSFLHRNPLNEAVRHAAQAAGLTPQ